MSPEIGEVVGLPEVGCLHHLYHQAPDERCRRTSWRRVPGTSASKIVSGVAIVATSASAFRPSFFPSTASFRLLASVNRSRFFPARSISARFTVLRYSIWSV